MLRKLLIAFIFLIITALIAETYHKQQKNLFQKKQNEEERSIPLQDRMDLAMQQEFELTKDQATNSVPRERLLAAYKYAEQLRHANGTGISTESAIPGVNWTERGPNNIGGRTRAIMVDPNDGTKKTVWAGGVGGGLWKTADITVANPVWTAINNFFSNIAITTIVYDPSSPMTMYFGTGEGNYNADAIQGLGIWKSTNGGTTWSQLAATNNSNFYFIQKIIVYPGNSHVFAATRSGLFKSKDGGTTWVKVLGSGAGASSNRIADVGVAADGSVWASTGMFTTDGIYKAPSSGLTTGDAGTYTKMNTGANGFPTAGFYWITLALAPSNASVCYALVESTSNTLLNIYKTVDGGANWTTTTIPSWHDQGSCGSVSTDMTRTQAWYDLPGTVDPNNSNIVYVGGVDLLKSTDGGTTWTQISNWAGSCYQYVHADQHIILFEQGNSSVIYFGNDGGIWRTTNGTAATPTITQKNSGYNVTQYYGCAIHPTAYSNYFLAGAQDNGTHKFSTSGINSVTSATGGDGCFCHIDQDQPQYQWTSYVYNNFYRSTNSGASWTGVSFGGGSFVSPTDYDNASNVLYAYYNGGNYLRWTDPQSGSTSLQVNVTAFGGSNVTHVSVSQNTPNRVFFGLSNGRVVQVDNANTVGTPVAGVLVGTPVANNSVSCIAFENGNDNHILVTYSNYGITSVWESTNALSGTPTFTSVEGNLPDMPVRWALFSPLNNQQAMIATEVGVWTTDLLNGASTNWAPSNSGLANTRVDMLQIRSSDNLVAAATHGRGLFTSDIFMSPYPDFTASPLVTYTNKATQFTDGSYKATSWAWNFGDASTSTLQNPTHAYTNPGLYTITLVINGNSAYTKVKTSFIQVLPDRVTPYLVANGDGGSFDVNPLDFGAENLSGTPWERGNSAIANKNGTVSGSFAWVTGLTAANYVDNTNSNLYCPNYNLQVAGTYTLSFYGKWRTEQDYDGFRIEYSLNKGTSWNLLGSYGPPAWYNFNNSAGGSSFPTGEAFFCSDTGNTYRKFSNNISFLGGNTNVAFRFVFKSDPGVTRAGVAIDNFEIQGPPNNPLPVELVSFNGQPKKNYNLLMWSTASEINNRGFELQRSEDAKTFSPITFINGAGNSTSLQEYQYSDYNYSDVTNYYRLRQVDYDGKESLSSIISINNRNKEMLTVQSVYPNPFSQNLSILLNKEADELTIKIFDMQGRSIYSKTVMQSSRELMLNKGETDFSPGIYFLKIESGNETYVERIVKE